MVTILLTSKICIAAWCKMFHSIFVLYYYIRLSLSVILLNVVTFYCWDIHLQNRICCFSCSDIFSVAFAATMTEPWARSGNSYDGKMVERSKPKKIKVGL